MPVNALTKKPGKFLTVEIEGKKYNIPLASSLKVKEIRKLLKLKKLSEDEQFDFMIDFFSKYLGEELVDEFTSEDLTELFTLWNKANEQAGGMTTGES